MRSQLWRWTSSVSGPDFTRQGDKLGNAQNAGDATTSAVVAATLLANSSTAGRQSARQRSQRAVQPCKQCSHHAHHRTRGSHSDEGCRDSEREGRKGSNGEAVGCFAGEESTAGGAGAVSGAVSRAAVRRCASCLNGAVGLEHRAPKGYGNGDRVCQCCAFPCLPIHTQCHACDRRGWWARNTSDGSALWRSAKKPA